MDSDQTVLHRNFEIAEARKAQQLKQMVSETQLAGDICALLATEGGRRIARMLMEWTHVYHTVPPAPLEDMAFANGQRDIGLRWNGLLAKSDPKGYLKTIEESLNGG